MSAGRRSFLRGSALCFAANCGFVALGLFTGVLLARGLGAAGRGLLTTVIVWPVILTSASGLSLYDAILSFATREPHLRRRLFANAMLAALLQAGLVGAAAMIVLPRFVPLTLQQHRLLTINLALLPLWLGVELAGAVVHSHQRFDRVALTRVMAPLTAAPLILFLFVTHRLSPTTAMIAQWTGLLGQALLTTTFCLVERDVGLRPDLALYARSLRYAVRVHVGTLAGLGSRRVDHLTLTVAASARPLGLYAFAKTLTELLNNVSASVIVVLFPRLSSEPSARARTELAVGSARWTLLLGAAGAVAVHLLAPTFLHRVWGADFADALPLVDALLPAAVLLGLRNTLASALLAAGRTFAGSAAELASLLVIVPLLAVLVPRHGAVGAATAVSIAALVNCAVTAALFARTLGGEALVALFAGIEVGPRLWRALASARAALSPRRLERAVDVVLFATLLLSPLVFLPCPAAAFTLPAESGRRLFIDTMCRPKGWCAELGTLLALAGTSIEQRRAPTPPTRALRLFALAAAAQLGCFLTTVAFASDRLSALAELRTYFCMGGMFVVAAVTPRRARAALAATAAAATLVAVSVLVELRGHFLPGLGHAVDVWLVRPTAMMPHRNVAAAALFVGVPALAAMALAPSPGWRRPVALVATSLVAAALLATGSRASILAATLALVVLLACSRTLRHATRRRRGSVLAMLAAAATLRSFHAHAIEVPLLAKLSRMLHAGDVSWRDHVALWRFAVHHMLVSPLVGGGGAELARAWSTAQPANPMPGVHDVWLQLGASYGVIGLALWMVGAACLTVRLVRLRADGGDDVGAAALAGVLAGAMVLALVENVTDMAGCNIQLAALGGALFLRTTGDASRGTHRIRTAA